MSRRQASSLDRRSVIQGPTDDPGSDVIVYTLMRALQPLPSLSTELLANIGVLALAALILAVGSVILTDGMLGAARGTLHLSLLIGADVGIFVAFSAYKLRGLILRPLEDAVATAESITSGDLTRRLAHGNTTEFRRLAVSFNEMTDRLIAEQQLVVRSEKLASVGRFAAGVAHEVGNPLAAINAYAHILRDLATNNPSAAQAVHEIRREVDRIDRIVRGLLDYSRPRKATPYAVDVNDVVTAVTELLKTQGVLKRVDVTLDFSPPTPRVFGNRHDLEQILVNLFLNAADAMGGVGRLVVHTELIRSEILQRGLPRRTDVELKPVLRGPNPRARVWLDRASRPADVVNIVIADSGPGVPPEFTERIFDPYFTTKEPGRGTGLGLAIVARIVDGLGGTIWVTPAREGGAAFHMLFPLVPGPGDGIGMPAITLGAPAISSATPR
jgi:signal transduction histidine kinase